MVLDRREEGILFCKEQNCQGREGSKRVGPSSKIGKTNESGRDGFWPFRSMEIFGRIKNEQEIDNVWWGRGKRLLSMSSWDVMP